MPKPLHERCKPDSIREFRLAAKVRYFDAQLLAEAGRRSAAVYLWGYSAEMMVKAAYFSAIGYAVQQPITLADLDRGRKQSVSVHGIPWSGGMHNIEGWARLLVNERARLGKPYTVVIASRIISHAGNIYKYWRETLRYHKNRAWPFEAARVQASVDWLSMNLAAR
jgi:hypothetical protein